MNIKSDAEVISDGHTFSVISNIVDTPDVLIIGAVGAKDLCLFPNTPNNNNAYTIQTGKKPETITTQFGDFIINKSRGGGAAHYIIEQLPFYIPDDCTLGLFSIIGRNENLNEIISHLDLLNIKYYLLHDPNMPCPKWSGLIFPNGWRYWSKEYAYQQPMTLFTPNVMPEWLKNCPITVITTLPLQNIYQLSIKCTGLLVSQIFENYISKNNFSQLNELISEIWPRRCAVININERELLTLSNFVYSTACNSSKSSKTSPQEMLQRFLPDTVFLTGIGELGTVTSLGGKNPINFRMPAIPSDWSFGIGAGDTALASALGQLLKMVLKKGYPIQETMLATKEFGLVDWFQIATAFIEGGYVGNAILDAFTPLEIRKKFIESARTKSTNVKPIMNFFLRDVTEVEESSDGKIIDRTNMNKKFESILHEAFHRSWSEIG